MRTTTMAKATQVYRLRIRVIDLQPPIWRRVEVEDCTLLKLHKVVQVSMGWEGRHAWAFFIGDEEYGDDVIDAGGDREFISARKAKLGRFVGRGVQEFRYVYDFGDNWEHVIRVERVLEPEPGAKYPRCVGGSRACPPEECGGPWGYEKLQDAIADPCHERHDETLDRVGDEFDPEAFDLEAANQRLARVR
jgi:hypothetical protein